MTKDVRGEQFVWGPGDLELTYSPYGDGPKNQKKTQTPAARRKDADMRTRTREFKRMKAQRDREAREALTPDQRRELVLRALRRESTMQQLADEYGVAPSWFYVLLKESTTNARQKLEEAEREAEREIAFRKEVLDILANPYSRQRD